MSESNERLADNEIMKSCYNCGSKIIDIDQKVCYNCKTILNPNDLKWKSSFIFFLCLLCLVPLLIAIISTLM